MFRSSSANCGRQMPPEPPTDVPARPLSCDSPGVVSFPEEVFLAKIAVELEQALKRRALSGAPGNTVARRLAEGNGWTVSDVVCTSGPQDRPFEERHSGFSIAIVAAGRLPSPPSAAAARGWPRCLSPLHPA